MRNLVKSSIAVVVFPLLIRLTDGGSYGPRPEFGYPAGLISDCPGVLKNATISPKSLEYLKVTLHRVTSTGITRRIMPVDAAPKMVARDKLIDLKNKKTLFYAVGFWDSSVLPLTQSVGTAYSKRGYNVFISETFAFLTQIYPKSARLVQFIGKKMGEFLVKLTLQGLEAENLEMVGASLGAHEVSYAAKYFYSKTGKKPSRITGLDPAGPCFRALDTDHKLFRTDAEKVDIIHTNIDGFGTPETLGHIDIYVNGGEFQPSDIPYIPCLVLCSHVRSVIYWWQAIEHPKKFIATKCGSVQDARFGDCFNNSVPNYLGLDAKFDIPGIYYLSTNNEFPYYMGKEGVKLGDNIYVKVTKRINAEDDWVI